MTADATPEIRTFAGLYTYDRLNRLRGSRRSYWSDNAFGPPTDNLASEYTYDPNGNIQTLTRRNATGSAFFDNFTYMYGQHTNRLDAIQDFASTRFSPTGGSAQTDIPEGEREYIYDVSGNLVSENGNSLTWSPYGKIEVITKAGNTGEIRILYDAKGYRILKEEVVGGNVSKRTWYVRDAAGQHLVTYEQSNGIGIPTATEYLLYGSSRLGIAFAEKPNNGGVISGALYSRIVNEKQYDITDYLGNVRASLKDVKIRSGSTFAPVISAQTEYFPFGMIAHETGERMRFGFNGMESDNEVGGDGNSYTTLYRQYDPRIGRWKSIDPRSGELCWQSPYVGMDNKPIIRNDVDGDCPQCAQIAMASAVGAALEMLTQIGEHMSQGMTFSAALEKVDYVQVMKSALESGALAVFNVGAGILVEKTIALVKSPIAKRILKEVGEEFLAKVSEIVVETGADASGIEEFLGNLLGRKTLSSSEIGIIGENHVYDVLEKKYPNHTIVRQVEGTFDDGTKTVFDFVVYDSKGVVIEVAESKANSGQYTDAQEKFWRDLRPVVLETGQIVDPTKVKAVTYRVEVDESKKAKTVKESEPKKKDAKSNSDAKKTKHKRK